MSGICGIVHRDGRPVNTETLRKMTESLAFRGPDAQGIWARGPAGLGHALLVTGEDRGERQPANSNQQTWIVADARLDAREELADALCSQGLEASANTSDPELLLHAYAAWGEECLKRILGDFAFAIWDAQQRRLFCACDHFGIKTLYYSEIGSCLIFSNTLDCVRVHPDVPDRLNDAAIADFLLFGLNYDNGTTTFADIRRLPPAHLLRWSREGLQCERYWLPPTDGCVRYRTREEYAENLWEVLKKAVEDRLPRDRAGILLSGGLDSSSVAAATHELRKQKFPRLELHAFTTTCEKLVKDNDATAARTAAEALLLIRHATAMGSRNIFDERATERVPWPEPMENPFACIDEEFHGIAEHVRVVFSGEGSDNLMEFEIGQHLRGLWRRRQIGRLITDIGEHVAQRFRAPDGIRGPLGRISRMNSRRKTGTPIPPWINPDLVTKLDLDSRWEKPLPDIPWESHPNHPKAYGSLFFPQWTCMFQQENAGVTRQPVEVRYPFLDLRVVNFLLAIPAVPWFFRKQVLRDAVRGKLPEKIRMRPKKPIRKDPIVAALRDSSAGVIEQALQGEVLDRFVVLKNLAPPLEDEDSERVMLRLRPLCLRYWLQSAGRIGYTFRGNAGDSKPEHAAG